MMELQVIFLPLLFSITATTTPENNEPYTHTQSALLEMKLGAQKETKARLSSEKRRHLGVLSLSRAAKSG
jgi:hypothetical protein